MDNRRTKRYRRVALLHQVQEQLSQQLCEKIGQNVSHIDERTLRDIIYEISDEILQPLLYIEFLREGRLASVSARKLPKWPGVNKARVTASEWLQRYYGVFIGTGLYTAADLFADDPKLYVSVSSEAQARGVPLNAYLPLKTPLASRRKFAMQKLLVDELKPSMEHVPSPNAMPWPGGRYSRQERETIVAAYYECIAKGASPTAARTIVAERFSCAPRSITIWAARAKSKAKRSDTP